MAAIAALADHRIVMAARLEVTWKGDSRRESIERGIARNAVRSMIATSNAHGGAATPEMLEEVTSWLRTPPKR